MSPKASKKIPTSKTGIRTVEYTSFIKKMSSLSGLFSQGLMASNHSAISTIPTIISDIDAGFLDLYFSFIGISNCTTKILNTISSIC